MPRAQPVPAAASRRPAARSSRERLFTAASTEFAARGFDGANVDRIARVARVNKAMIYYHFASKAALYREILREMFEAVSVRVGVLAHSPIDPAEKIRAFVEAIATEAEARPHFPPIWCREIADGGRHLDVQTAGYMAAILKVLGGIVAEGVAAKRFRPVKPLFIHVGIVGPLLLYFASAEARKRLAQRGVPGADHLERREVVAHIQNVAIGTLEGHTS
jgi:AcrR family transcriptional regulator